MKLTLGQAAKYAKRSKGTISNALKNGNLSGEKVVKNGRETWQIEPSELQRWLEYNPFETDTKVQDTTPVLNTPKPIETNALQIKLEAAEQRYEDLLKSSDDAAKNAAKTIDDLRERLDQEGEERRQLTAMLTDQRRQEAPKGFWSRLFGK